MNSAEILKTLWSILGLDIHQKVRVTHTVEDDGDDSIGMIYTNCDLSGTFLFVHDVLTLSGMNDYRIIFLELNEAEEEKDSVYSITLEKVLHKTNYPICTMDIFDAYPHKTNMSRIIMFLNTIPNVGYVMKSVDGVNCASFSNNIKVPPEMFLNYNYIDAALLKATKEEIIFGITFEDVKVVGG